MILQYSEDEDVYLCKGDFHFWIKGFFEHITKSPRKGELCEIVMIYMQNLVFYGLARKVLWFGVQIDFCS